MNIFYFFGQKLILVNSSQSVSESVSISFPAIENFFISLLSKLGYFLYRNFFNSSKSISLLFTF